MRRWAISVWMAGCKFTNDHDEDNDRVMGSFQGQVAGE